MTNTYVPENTATRHSNIIYAAVLGWDKKAVNPFNYMDFCLNVS